MRSGFKKWLQAAALGLGLSLSGAHAATLQSAGGSFSSLAGDFDPTWLAGSANLLSGFDLSTMLRGATVSLTAAAGLQYQVLGFEAGFNNALVAGNQSLTNRNGGVALLGTSFQAEATSGVLDFGFLSNGTGDLLGNGHQATGVVLAADQQSALLLFNDRYSDADFDDMVVYLSITHAPEPAMVSMLLAGLGLVAMGARRNKRQG